MPKFEKVVLTEGKFRQWNEATKQYEIVEVTPARLEKLSSNFQRQQAKGMRIPGPWKHDFNITALSTGNNGLLEDSTVNAGFWDSLVTKVLDNGKTALVGTIDAPGDLNDPNTPAGKIGTVVKDTSIYTRKDLPITSGVDKEEVLEEGIMHIALVTHPIELNQENFKLQNSNDIHLVMSSMVEEPEKQDPEEEPAQSSSTITQLIIDLKNVCKLFLPANTTIDNLAENLSIAVGQYQLLNSEDASGVKPDSFKVEPLLMSHLDPTQVDALINGKIVNPKTNKPYAKEDFSSSPSPEVDKAASQNLLVMSAMQNQMQADRRNSYRGRIDNLVATSRTTKAFADAQLYPQADSYSIDFKDNQIVTPIVETLLMSLEAMPAPTQSDTSGLTRGILEPDSANEQEMTEMAKYMASLV
jgi:hypothetical protein